MLVGWLAGVGGVAGAGAQDSTSATSDDRWEAWPEVDFWVRLNPRTQLFFPVSLTRAKEVDYLEGLVGAHIDHRPLRHLSMRVGYRYLWSISDRGEDDRYRESRVVAELTPRVYLPLGVLLLDRNRLDLRWINGENSWRYRNRVRVERGFVLGGERAVTPYAMTEFGYDSRYDEFNRVRLQAGAEYQFDHALWVDVYYVRQRDDRSSVPRLNAIGVAVNLAFCKWCSLEAPPPPDKQGT